MRISGTLFLTAILAGCSSSPTTTGSAEARYQHVGTYEQIATPIGSSISVLMVDGQKIKITSVDDTRYINISVNSGIPDIRISGTYGINGELSKSPHSERKYFIVREIEHFGGGQEGSAARRYPALPDFFTVDGNARGPVTLAELQISFPDSLARYFNNYDMECFYQQVEIRATELGDPVTMPPIRRVLLINGQMRWNEMSNADKRLQMARYVTSMALHAC